MLKIAVSTTGTVMDSAVPAYFEDATYLLIVDAEKDELLSVVDGGDLEPEQRSMYFAYKTVEFDCEALLSGEIEAEPFAVLAEENGVTRYLAAGMSAIEGVHKMNDYALPIIADYMGGTGCPEPDPANCEAHDHDDDGDGDDM